MAAGNDFDTTVVQREAACILEVVLLKNQPTSKDGDNQGYTWDLFFKQALEGSVKAPPTRLAVNVASMPPIHYATMLTCARPIRDNQ